MIDRWILANSFSHQIEHGIVLPALLYYTRVLETGSALTVGIGPGVLQRVLPY